MERDGPEATGASYFRLAAYPHGYTRVFSFAWTHERTRPKINSIAD